MPAKYEILADALRRAVLSGQWPGGKLPGEQALAQQYAVSRETLRAALELLVRQGLVEKRKGSGTYIKETVPSGKTIAVVVGYRKDYIFPALLEDMQTLFFAHGYTVETFETLNRTSREREVLQQLLAGGYAGVLMEGVRTALPSPNTDLCTALVRSGVPLVFYHGCPAELPDAVCISDDNSGGAYLLTRHLISLGHRRIGGIFKSDDSQGAQRYLGYALAMRDAGLSLPDDALLWFDTEDRNDLLNSGDLSLLHAYIRHRLGSCTAVVCYNDELAHSLVRALAQKGIAVPGQVSVAGFDNSVYSTCGAVPLTTLAHTAQSSGQAAAQALLALLGGKPCKSLRLPWRLLVRESTAPPAPPPV